MIFLENKARCAQQTADPDKLDKNFVDAMEHAQIVIDCFLSLFVEVIYALAT